MGGDDLMTDSTSEVSADASAEAPDVVVGAPEMLVLARIAGLPIDERRAAGLARELANTYRAVRELDLLLADQPDLASHAFRPFDAAWPADSASGPGAGR